jgi:hypothetical protein
LSSSFTDVGHLEETFFKLKSKLNIPVVAVNIATVVSVGHVVRAGNKECTHVGVKTLRKLPHGRLTSKWKNTPESVQ